MAQTLHMIHGTEHMQKKVKPKFIHACADNFHIYGNVLAKMMDINPMLVLVLYLEVMILQSRKLQMICMTRIFYLLLLFYSCPGPVDGDLPSFSAIW